MNSDVGVKKEDEGGGGKLGAEVARRRGTERLLVSSDDGPLAARQCAGVVCRPIVDRDQLIIRPGGVTKPAEAALEIAAPVANGDHNGKRRPPRLRARRTGGDIVHD
jgi:hypothetical protein